MYLHFPLPLKRAGAAVSSGEGAAGSTAARTGLETPLVAGGGRLEVVVLVAWLELRKGLNLAPLVGERGGFEVWRGLLKGVGVGARRSILAAVVAVQGMLRRA